MRLLSEHIMGGFFVAVLSPTGGAWTQVRLAGSIDEAAVPQLATVAGQLAETVVAWVFVDVAEVTFADVTLPRFCIHLRTVLPARSALHVCRPGPMTRLILQDAAARHILTLRDDLPLLDASGAMPGHGWMRRNSSPSPKAQGSRRPPS